MSNLQLSGGFAQAVAIILLAIIAFASAWGFLQSRQSSDHDLLVEIRSEVQAMRIEIRDLDGRIVRLETILELQGVMAQGYNDP